MYHSKWVNGASYIHQGWMIFCVEENGRRFFKTSDPTPKGLWIPQEFSSIEETKQYIDDQEKFKTTSK